MSEPTPIAIPTLVFHLHYGGPIVAGPGAVIQIRPNNKRGPSIGLSEIREVELRFDDERQAT